MFENLPQEWPPAPAAPEEAGAPPEVPAAGQPVAQEPAAEANGVDHDGRHAAAGRKGANRVHELIRAGKLYEQEHGLKRGRQRLRQLIELGKVYEQEHGLRPESGPKGRERLSRLRREEVLTTLLRCLVRIARPSFRAELTRLIEAVDKTEEGRAA